MRFYTEQECEAWLKGRERVRPNAIPGMLVEQMSYPPTPARIQHYAHWIATSLTYRDPTLLWITEWGIWSANWHLYYRLRQSYADQRLLHEAPGHLFLEFEAEDLASYLQLAMLNGWGGYVLTGANYVNLFFSHDEYIQFFSTEESNLAEIREALREKRNT
ncbi:MAG: hypothetical protein ABR976_05760 [Terracidiphilus sp.]|jgi:hypothetical protein